MALRSSTPQIDLIQLGSVLESSQLKFSAQMEFPFALRFKVCEFNSYEISANASIAPIAGKGDLLKTHQIGKDLEIHSDASLEGEIWITVDNPVAEQVTIRIGPPEVGNLILDYSQTITFGHNILVFESGDYAHVGSVGSMIQTLGIAIDKEDFVTTGSNLEFWPVITMSPEVYNLSGSKLIFTLL